MKPPAPRPMDAALALAAAGWPVLPCRAHDIDDRRKAKAPLTTHGHLDASLDRALIRAWWSRWPDAMIGSPVPEGAVVIDIDPRNGGSSEALEARCGARLPPTLTVWSGRQDGGMHRYHLRPSGLVVVAQPMPGIDVKTTGYMLMPPSRHPATGRPYRWEWRPYAPLTPELRALITPQKTPRRTAEQATRSGSTTARSAALLRELAKAPEGQRNSYLFWAACRAAEAGFLAELGPAMLVVAQNIGLTAAEAARTIRSADARPRRAGAK